MSRQKRIFDACTYAAKTGERVPLESIAVSAFRFIRAEVIVWNKQNPPWECSIIKEAEELVVVPIKAAEGPVPPLVEMFQAMTTQSGGDADSVARGHYDRATSEDVVAAKESFNRARLVEAVKSWNYQKRGDVVVRKYRGQWVFYRRQWLGGRDFYKAVETWLSCQGTR